MPAAYGPASTTVALRALINVPAVADANAAASFAQSVVATAYLRLLVSVSPCTAIVSAPASENVPVAETMFADTPRSNDSVPPASNPLTPAAL